MITLNQAITIAVDGYSSCGKSTYAKRIASALNYVYIDSGAMYRAVALEAIRKGAVTATGLNNEFLGALLPKIKITFSCNAKGTTETLLNGENVEDEIRSLRVSNWVSLVSKVEEVRSFLVNLQQQMGVDKSIVMDGRDIGTKVFPNAELKIFMKADADIRAKRRYDELIAKGVEANYQEVLDGIIERDRNDETREISPLRRADDAILLNNSHMSIDEQMDWFMGILKEKQLLKK